MTTPAQPRLTPGRVYRTRDLARWSANPPRLARRLVRDAALVPLGRGLFVHPKEGRFGRVPPADEELLRAFLGGPYLVTGPDRWNALGLGTTAVFSASLVYNTKRSGRFDLGGRPFVFRRVAFPNRPTPEWFVVDLLENAAAAGASRRDLVVALGRAVGAGRFDPERLTFMAREYGTRSTLADIQEALRLARP